MMIKMLFPIGVLASSFPISSSLAAQPAPAKKLVRALTFSLDGSSGGPTTVLNSSTAASATLAECLSEKNVPIKLPSDADFSQIAQSYNVHLNYDPIVIVMPTTVQHISNAVVCASENDIKVQARSGGHSYAAFSSGGRDGSMVINLQEFQNITLNEQGIAKVGGGVRLGNLAQSIYEQGKRALSHGTCPGVGIGGHFTHGGYGFASRYWGLAMDQIIGLDVVLANGSTIYASETTYPDIYFALRGAADSIGIITTFHLQTYNAPSSAVFFFYSLPGMWEDAAQTASYFQNLQTAAQNSSIMDAKVGGVSIFMDGTSFLFSGSYFGTLNDFESRVAPELLRGLPTPTVSTVEPLSWIDFLRKPTAAETLIMPKQYDEHENFFAKSVTVPESTPLTGAALRSYFSYMITAGKSAPGSWLSIFNLYGGPGSAIKSKNDTFAAYKHRDDLWVVQHWVSTDVSSALPPSATTFINGLNNAMTKEMPGTQFGAYPNYVDASLSAADAHRLYYGDSLYQKLLEIKKAVDPQSVFWNPQAIDA